MAEGVSDTPDAGSIEEDVDILGGDDGGDGDATAETGGGTSPEESETPSGEETDGAEEETDEGEPGEDVEEPGDVDEVDEEEEGKEKTPPTEGEETGEEHQRAGARLVKALEKKYPELFKTPEGKELRAAFWQRNQFAEHFASPEEAKDAVEDLKDFREYEQTIDAGDPSLLVSSLSKNPENFDKFMMALLPTIQKVQPPMVGKMLFPHVRQIFVQALEDAKAAGNKNLSYSVGHLARYLWGGKGEIPGMPSRATAEETPEMKQLRDQAEQATTRVEKSFRERLYGNAGSQLTNLILGGLREDKRFSPIEKKAIAGEIESRIRKALDRDPRHTRQMGSLWTKAKSNNWPEELIPRLTNAFLGGAQQLLPTLRARVVTEALREKGVVQSGKGRLPGTPPGGGQTRTGQRVSSSSIDYSRTSDDDILSGDPGRIKLKGRK